MLKPEQKMKTKNRTTWNQSNPYHQTYSGTAVRESASVLIRNKLVGQLIRAVGMRNIFIYFSNRPSRFRAGHDGASDSQNRAKGKSEQAIFRTGHNYWLSIGWTHPNWPGIKSAASYLPIQTP